MVIVLEMGSRQITHITVLICRDPYDGNSPRTGVSANNTYHSILSILCYLFSVTCFLLHSLCYMFSETCSLLVAISYFATFYLFSAT